MSSSARYVFDTNTLVSAVFFEHSAPGQALRRALKQGEVLISPATLEELAEVLQREKFDRYVTAAEREEFLEAFVERATFVEPAEEIRICRDAKDDKFLELAVSGGAAYLISGDNDLRSLNPFRGIAIVTASEFLAATSGEEDV
ncbi:MAG TPA: putative toxin-antitoxin system toxin component, PIN family [Alphaproteobacteria bacterium]|jgi:putative PIN family toxin of toxin-antitoxin system|nr:putative toxin-antitoxin system toxin component, PIN family [Alphaproteobacteria bacterium]